MKRLLTLALLGAMTAPVAAATHHSSDSGVAMYDVHGAPPVLHCPVNMLCDVALVASDRLSTDKPPVAGDMDDFDIRGTATPPHVFIVPLKPGVSTSVTILAQTETGDERTYHVFVDSVPNLGQTSGINIAFRDDSPKPTPPPVVIVPSIATPAPNPLAAVDLRTLDCNSSEYRIAGNAPFRPVQVCRDPIRTFIQIPTTPELPALLGADEKWTPRTINESYEDGYFIVAAHYTRFILLLGSQRVTIEYH